MLRLTRYFPIPTGLRFCISGSLATAAHYLVMAGAIGLGWSSGAATALGAAIGALLNYVLQYSFTFRATGGHGHASPRYLLSVLLSWLLNLVFFLVLTAGFSMNIYAAQLLTTAAVALCNYAIMKRYVFV
ncbi:MAG: GtrA family protein [Burkholderiaceae bacterium]